MFCMFYIKSL